MAVATYSRKAAHGLVKTVTKSGRYSATYHERRLYPKGDSRQTSLYLPTQALQEAASKVKAPEAYTVRVLGPASERLPRYTREQHVADRTAQLRARHEEQRRAGAAERSERLAEAELSVSVAPRDLTNYRTDTEGQARQATLSLDASSLNGALADSTYSQRLAAQELEAVLELHLTEKELRALKQRAEGIAVEDRHTLQRAQRKAQQVVAPYRKPTRGQAREEARARYQARYEAAVRRYEAAIGA